MGQHDFPSKEHFRIGMGLINVHQTAPANDIPNGPLQTKNRKRVVPANRKPKSSNFPSKDFFLYGLGLLSDDELRSNPATHNPNFQFDREIERGQDLPNKVRVAKNAIKWAVDKYGDKLVMSTSFGLQSAVLLHLATSVNPDIPTLWVDTGYLPTETYKYAHYLKQSLRLNLKICQSEISPAHMEALYGKLWESPDPSDRRLYGVLRKVVPLKNMLSQLGAKCMLAGLRKSQTDHRQNLHTYEAPEDAEECAKMYPLLHWTKEDVAQYFVENSLPQHPLFYQGYTTVGDAHSSRPKSSADKSDRDTRFGGSGQQECGLHTEGGSVSDYRSLVEKSVKVQLDDMTATPNTLNLSEVSDLVRESASKDSPCPFVVFGRVQCRFCRAAKLLLKSVGDGYVDVLVRKPGEDIPSDNDQRKYVDLLTLVPFVRANRGSNGIVDDEPFVAKTVPQLFLRGVHIGGYTDLCALVGASGQEQQHFLSIAEDELAAAERALSLSLGSSVETASELSLDVGSAEVDSGVEDLSEGH